MDRNQIVTHYIEKVKDPNFEIYHVRRELERKNIPEDEIKIIVKLVDNEVQKMAIKQAEAKKMKNLMFMGGVFTIGGAAITITSYLGILDTGDSFVIAYGPFISGLATFFGAYTKYKQLTEN